MTKHFAEEGGSCVLSDKVYTLKDWIKLEQEPERCSCGARQRSECIKESTSGYGKMCVKELKEEKK